MFSYERDVGADRLTLRRDGTRWLATCFDGGYRTADAAHNLTVPEGFDRTDLATYAAERLGDRPPGPTLLTGVSQRHARGARTGPVEVVATAGLSNPAALPVDPEAIDGGEGTAVGRDGTSDDTGDDTGDGWRPGTVNVFVGTTRSLDAGAMAELLATTVEAKAATLLPVVGVAGTTSDAVVVGADPDGEAAAFAGSATTVGGAARTCVRDALLASLESRYADEDPPTLDDARYGLVSSERASVFEP